MRLLTALVFAVVVPAGQALSVTATPAAASANTVTPPGATTWPPVWDPCPNC